MLGKIEEGHRPVDGPLVQPRDPLQGLGHPGHVTLQVIRFGPQRGLVDRAGEVGVEQPLLHVLEFAQPFRELRSLLRLVRREVREDQSERLADQVANVAGADAQRGEVGQDGVFDVGLTPAEPRMARRRGVVRAAVVDVLVDAAVLQTPPNPLAGDGTAAVRASQQATRQRDVRRTRPAIAAVQDVLAYVEERSGDQLPVLAREGLATPHDVTDVVAVVQDVRERGARETRLARAVDVPLSLEPIGQLAERHVAAAVELEDTDDRARLLGVRLDRFVAVIDVDVAVRSKAGGPALSHLLVHALQDLGAEVVAVVLRDGGHHVERQRAGGARAELVLDEGELDAVLILEFLEPHGVAHVAAGAIELVAENDGDLLTLGVGPQPLEHVVERQPLGAALGGLRDDELADDGPAVLLGPFAAGPQLGVERVPLALFAGGDARPDDHVHVPLLSWLAWSMTSAKRRRFWMISSASARLTGRR